MKGFDDLLAANEHYQHDFSLAGASPLATAGIAIITCMDARLEPLAMFGLTTGQAKVLRTPGGHLDAGSLNGCILAVQLLGVNRICVVEHTLCAMAGGNDDDLICRIAATTGDDASTCVFGSDPRQQDHLRRDVATLKSHPLVGTHARIGGFLYDTDTGTLKQIC